MAESIGLRGIGGARRLADLAAQVLRLNDLNGRHILTGLPLRVLSFLLCELRRYLNWWSGRAVVRLRENVLAALRDPVAYALSKRVAEAESF